MVGYKHRLRSVVGHMDRDQWWDTWTEISGGIHGQRSVVGYVDRQADVNDSVL